jgi:hypothetical protein
MCQNRFTVYLPPKNLSQSSPKSAIHGQGFDFPDIKSAIPGQGYGHFGGLKSAIFRTNIRRSFRGPNETTECVPDRQYKRIEGKESLHGRKLGWNRGQPLAGLFKKENPPLLSESRGYILIAPFIPLSGPFPLNSSFLAESSDNPGS